MDDHLIDSLSSQHPTANKRKGKEERISRMIKKTQSVRKTRSKRTKVDEKPRGCRTPGAVKGKNLSRSRISVAARDFCDHFAAVGGVVDLVRRRQL